jgi:acyl carrier protein
MISKHTAKPWHGYERIRRVLSEQIGVEPSEIKLTDSLVDDLHMDSLDQIETVMGFEDEFGIDIPDTVAEKVRTVQDIVDIVKEQLDEK